MKPKHSTTALKRLALEGALSACEARAFAAFRAGTLDAATHNDYVDAFVLQLGAPVQHSAILALLATVERAFRAGKIAYKPPDAPLLTAVLEVARWVSARLEGGLAHAAVLERARRADAGGRRLAPPQAQDAAHRAMAALELRQLAVSRADTLRYVARTRLLADFVTHRALTGDAEAAARMARGEAGLLQLLERGTQDRKELETLVCAALRERGRLLVFTSAELLLDTELVALFGEADRAEGARRADAYLVVEEGAITYDAFLATDDMSAFFKGAARLGLVVGVSIKSDLGLRARRATSGELHLDRCPIVLFALPRVNERAGAMSDVMVYANVRPRFAVTPTGKICYVGGTGRLTTLGQVR